MCANRPKSPLVSRGLCHPGSRLNQGFTLIELVVGIVVFAIALTLFSSLLVPQAIKSVDPIYQVRSIELAQSLINEISGKSFDENSDRSGGQIRCNEVSAPVCTASGSLGAEELDINGDPDRAEFDDVDDYHNLSAADGNIVNSLGEDITIGGIGLYQGFQANVTVYYDDNADGVDDGIVGNRKLIIVSIVTPNDEVMVFSTYRNNY